LERAALLQVSIPEENTKWPDKLRGTANEFLGTIKSTETNMTAHEPVVHSDIPDSECINHVTVISGGIHNDLKMCLQQALEYLETGEHDGGWVALKTMDIQCVLELTEAVVDCCCRELKKYKQ
jgi:hypothetical protein